MKRLVALIGAIKLLWLGFRIKGDFKILQVKEYSEGVLIALPKNDDTKNFGRQSLFWDSRAGHALVEPLQIQPDEDKVWFRVERIFRGELRPKKSAWLSGWLGEMPEDFNLSNYEIVRLPNQTQALHFEGREDVWAIHVHGRKATFGEALRNARQFSELSFSQLFMSMESDDRPWGLAKFKSKLGSTEWKQVEMAVQFAKSKGAKSIVLFGWSMGAMLIGQFLRNSNEKHQISGVVFDSPLLDYVGTLKLQSKLAGYSEEVGEVAASAIVKSKTLKMCGFDNIDINKLSLLNGPIGTNVPILCLYSKNDGFIDMSGVEHFAQLNPNVKLTEIAGARHCRLFNQDQQKYQKSIATWIQALGI